MKRMAGVRQCRNCKQEKRPKRESKCDEKEKKSKGQSERPKCSKAHLIFKNVSIIK